MVSVPGSYLGGVLRARLNKSQRAMLEHQGGFSGIGGASLVFLGSSRDARDAFSFSLLNVARFNWNISLRKGFSLPH